MDLVRRSVTSNFVRCFSRRIKKISALQIRDQLSKTFPEAKVEVKDISGGSGAIYEIFVGSTEFKGLSTLEQHKVVAATLKDQIKNMHGIRIKTSSLKSQASTPK